MWPPAKSSRPAWDPAARDHDFAAHIAQTILIFDGILAGITLIAYVLAKEYTTWARLRAA